MSFKLDTSKFKKIRADKNSTTMRHEDGHELTISHKSLSPKMRSQLIAMPAAEKMAEGGEVEDADERSKKKAPPADDHDKKVAQGLTMDPNNPKLKSLGVIFKADGGEVDSPDKIIADAAAQAAESPQAKDAPPAPEESLMHKIGGYAGEIMSHTPTALAFKAAEAAAPAVKEGLTDAIAGARGMPSAELQSQLAQVDGPANPTAPAIPAPSPQAAPNLSSQPGAMSDPYGANTAFDVYKHGIEEGKAGIQQAAQAQQSLGADQVKAAEAQAQQQQQLQSDWQTHSRQILDDTKNALTALNEGHINPNHYMESMAAGKRVMTAIGLILGGIGGGASGKNAALDFLNSQIDRDINAQKAELGKKESVYSGFLKQYGNEKDATDMARIFQNQAYGLQLQKAAAANATPASQAAAKNALSALDMNTAQLQGQLAMRKTLLSGVNQGKVPPEMLLRAGVVADKDHSSFTKELKEAKDATQLRDTALNVFDQVAKINTVANRTLSPKQTQYQINALLGPVLDKITKDTSGRVTPQTAELVGSAFHTNWTDAKSVAMGRRSIQELLSQGMNYPTLKAYNVDVNAFGRPQRPTLNGKLAP